ncbi:MAG: restriction endonuclease subunit S [Erysipelotrichaceae bacterium]|nr:restriction endonuclease subunit S [Erysipelotrichaceae bacterium]
MKIAELCKYAPKSAIKAGDAVANGQYMFFTSSSDESKRYNSYQIDGERIIMGTGGNATLHYYNGKFAASTDCVVLQPNEQIKCKYLYYYFLANMGLLEAGFKGAGLKHTNKNYIGNLEIKELPAIDEQIATIDALDRIQRLISIQNKKISFLDELIKSRFNELFVDKGYPVKRWDDVFETKTGKLDSNAMVEDGEYPFFTCAKEIFKIDRYAFDQEALLLAGNNAAGKYDVKYYKGKFNAYQRTYVLGLKDNWSYRLFQYQLEDKLGYLQEQSLGGLTKYLTLKILGSLEFVIPPKDKQDEFDRFIEQLDKSKSICQKKIELYQELLDKKMDEYFGEEV